MKFQTHILIVLFMVLVELIQTRDAYKSIRPYKFYRPRPRGHKPRWHPFPRPSNGYRHLKKGPPPPRPRPHYRRPSNSWNLPRYAVDHIADEQPYTIEIELPKRQHGNFKLNKPYHRNYDRGIVDDFYTDDDYLDDDDEEFEERVMQTGKKKVRIKVVKGAKPKLRIKISRDDDFDGVENSTNWSLDKPILASNNLPTLKNLGQIIDEDWIPSNPLPSFPESLRGA